jgi:UTP:GlnB (protein PII) uridylyltransferase
MAAPLQQLAEAAGMDFPHLFAARELTGAKLAERRPRLQQLQHDEDVAIVLMGSWGRSEVTSGSDDDYMVPTRLGKELEHGLLAMLFETDSLPKLVREFGIF